jgi:hypothetical protein
MQCLQGIAFHFFVDLGQIRSATLPPLDFMTHILLPVPWRPHGKLDIGRKAAVDDSHGLAELLQVAGGHVV